MGKKHETYLGDGVYATYDGWHIVLDLRAQGTDRIALDPAVFEALCEFARKIAAKTTEETRQDDL